MERHGLTRAPADMYGAADSQVLSASGEDCRLICETADTNLEIFLLSVWTRNHFYQ